MASVNYREVQSRTGQATSTYVRYARDLMELTISITAIMTILLLAVARFNVGEGYLDIAYTTDLLVVSLAVVLIIDLILIVSAAVIFILAKLGALE